MDKTLIIGSCTVDIVVPTPKLPKSTEDINSGEHHYSLGGCAYNVAQIFNLLNLPFLHAVTIGSGIYGDFVKKELEKNNFPVFRTSNESHGACLCLVEDNGERSFIAYHGIEYKFDRSWFKDIDTSEFKQVFVCGLEVEEDTGSEIVSFLEENRIENIYFAPGPRLLTIDKDLLNRLMKLKPIIHLNEQEILDYTNAKDVHEAVRILHKENDNDIIVTLGKDGSLLYSKEEEFTLLSRESEVVDTVGAGDCHLGTYMAYRFMSKDKKEAMHKANLFASEVIRHIGSTLKYEDIKDLV
ncbi:MAG: PfkB family carbohydrate kinase [Erysipelotrichaceae bacterium]|nr:PfkB family carbohydrate kinase [Erysipelotrichaceae bacterium]